MSAWYLIQTKPRQESLARINLERQGYIIYLPRVSRQRARRQLTGEATAPLFPRYLFIHLNEGIDDWAPIRSTLGVQALVRFGQIPARVPDALIESIKSRENEQGIHVLDKHRFSVGDRVRIIDGPFDGIEAVIFSKTAKERTVLLMKLLEKYVKVEINDINLEPAKH